MTTRFVDLVGGNDANDGSTFVLRKKTVSSAMSGLVAGDSVRVMASPSATEAQTATWTNGSNTVTLTTAATASITDCETAWTASANVTATAATGVYRMGSASAYLSIASGFSTGLIAYQELGSAIDLSAYQQVSLLMRLSAYTASGVFQLKLCSDTAGAVPVNTITLPSAPSGYWQPVVVDLAASLGSSIQSVALYAVSDPGTVIVYLDNIIACKASGAAGTITHYSLISKATDEDEPWFGLQSINGTTLTLGAGNAATSAPTSHFAKYYGATESVTTYVREPILASASMSLSGTAGVQDNPVLVSGGWDRTAMTSQADRTWIRMIPASPVISDLTYGSHRIQKFGAISPGSSAYELGGGTTLDDCVATGSTYGAYYNYASYGRIFNARYLVGCNIGVYYDSNTAGHNFSAHVGKIWGLNSASGSGSIGVRFANIAVSSVALDIGEIQNTQYGISDGGTAPMDSVRCKGTTFSNNYKGHYLYNTAAAYFKRCIGLVAPGDFGPKVYHTYFDDTDGDHRTWWSDGSIISSESSIRHTSSGLAWKFSIATPAGYDFLVGSASPVCVPVARIAVASGVETTVSLYFYRVSTAIQMRLRLKGGQISGIDSDVSASPSGTGAYEQVTISFTPTETGVVDIGAEAWAVAAGTPGVGYIDDLTVA